MAMKFIQARNYTKNTRGPRSIDLLVIHTMEAPEDKQTAENVANWFAGPSAPQASAHYCIDNNSVVQCVHDHDIAWAAPNANHNGLHYEHAGYARQTHSQWDDVYSIALLKRSARLVATAAKYYGVPIRFLDASAVKQGKLGITGHLQITRAFPGTGTHTDPGTNFPWGRYIRYVKAYAAGRVPVTFEEGEL